jgi:hypothetical protein
MAEAPRKLVTIEDSLLISMAANPAFVKEFPFLKSLEKPQALSGKPNCGGCRKTQADRTLATMSAKVAIATMSNDKKKRLKQLINTDQVRVKYREGNRVLQKTF